MASPHRVPPSGSPLPGLSATAALSPPVTFTTSRSRRTPARSNSIQQQASAPRSYSPLPPVSSKAMEKRHTKSSPIAEAHYQPPMEAVDRYVQQELRLLGLGLSGGAAPTPAVGSSGEAKAAKQRLGIYKSAFGMLGRFMSDDARGFIERMFAEYDTLLAYADRAVKDSSLEAERKRLEERQAQELAIMRADLEADLESRTRKVQQAEAAVKAQLHRLEDDKAALETENARMRAQQAEEHERILMMSQSVVDARMAAQVGENNYKTTLRQLEAIKKAEASKLDLLSDLSDLQLLLRQHQIPFKCKMEFLFDDKDVDSPRPDLMKPGSPS